MKVFPVWNGGGTVKIVFVNSDWGVPSSTLVDTVQTAVDPTQNQGEGAGIAPIGHVVTVVGVTGTAISVSFKLTFATGYAWDTVKTAVTKAIPGLLRGPGEGLGEPVGDHRPRVPGGNEGPVPWTA